jgi:flagellar basal-body rod protein FlgC
MSTFDAVRIAGSGLYANRKWLDAVSDNIANINTAKAPGDAAFQERMIVAEAVDYGSGQGGVRVAATRLGSTEGRLVYQPDHALADESGYVKYPDIDLGDQMTQLIMAQRSYQANLATIERATTAYQQALQLGKG